MNQLVDNNTYNLITALSSALEANEVYQKYMKDGNQQIWQQLSQLNQQAVQLLHQELSRTLQNQSQSQTSQGGFASQSQSQGGMHNQSGTGSQTR